MARIAFAIIRKGDAMSTFELPVYPLPVGDELLSSWIERIGIFYGCDYEHWFTAVLSADGRPPRNARSGR